MIYINYKSCTLIKSFKKENEKKFIFIKKEEN